MALQAENIADLVLSTQKELGELRWTMIATDLQEYVMLPQLLKKSRVQLQGGQQIQFNVQYKLTGSAAMTGLNANDSVGTTDVGAQGTVPWRHLTANYSIDERMVKMNSGKYMIYDLLKQRRLSALTDIAVLLEQQGWNKPEDSSDDLNLYGIPYWVVKNASAGFNGGNPAGFSSGCAGLSSSTYANWKNYTDKYTASSGTGEDLVGKLRAAYVKTQFKPPVPMPEYGGAGTVINRNSYGLYSVYQVIADMETALKDQNQNLGMDIAATDGQLLFRRVPVTWVPYLESDTSYPVYGINWNKFNPVFLAGEWMKESEPRPAPTKHRTVVVYIDCSLNLICRDRRANFVVYK